MQFNTAEFLIFFAAIFCIYYLTRPTWRWVVLLTASLFFYATLKAPQLIIALALVTIISYIVGRILARLPDESGTRKMVLWLGILLNLAVLAIIRYLPDLANFLPVLSLPLHNLPNLGVSVGVSFYVFQAISYLVDIYYDEQPAEYHLGYFSLYISFFPKLLQGPIERASNLLPQLHKPKALTDEMIRSALLLFAWGLFKKVVIADRLGILVDAVYDHLPKYVGISLWLATFFYALQIYCDFSGYTDMAIGVARLLGINLSINFNKPYLAVSIADFWRRWHISFSTWIFDYIFKPVQMNLRRWKTWASPVALLVTFFLSGIWHGASWGFVVWGLLHGIYMAVYVLLAPYEKKFLRRFKLEKSTVVRLIQIAFTFVLICFAWIFFRAKTLADGWYVVSHLFPGLNILNSLMTSIIHDQPIPKVGLQNYFTIGGSPVDYIFVLIGLLVLLAVELPENLAKTRLGIAFQKNMVFRWVVYWLLVMSILTIGAIVQTEFVYFRF
ncbi:MAG: MBOAT family O-acyltransferase [Anaerolineales bacterium]|jgi:D-alanyl-lipoteichoic acid acyltransferase DltB (MBOAT superfamily)